MTNLDRTWKNCLRMWKWISENLPKGFGKLCWEEKVSTVNALKTQWLRDHRFTKDIDENCFFCEYAGAHGGCRCNCPGILVNRHFHCNVGEQNCSWAGDPKGFYRELISLDKKRRTK